MKNLLSRAVALPLFLFAVACSSNGGDSVFTGVSVAASDIELCCDPDQGPPGKVGQLTVQVLVPVDVVSAEAKITYTAASPARLSVPSGSTVIPGTTTIDVLLDDCNFTEVVIDVEIEMTGTSLEGGVPYRSTDSRQIRIRNTCPPAPVIPPQIIAETIVGMPIANFTQYTMAVPTGVLTWNSNLSVPQSIPEPKTETFQIGYVVTNLDQAQLDNAFTGPNPFFPLGQGPLGTTLAAEFAAPMVPGRYVLTWQCVQAPIPTNHAVDHLQYAYVADRDLNPANNYFGQSPFLGDYFDNSDTWYSAEYSPVSDWRFRITDARNGTFFSMFSGAKCILHDQVQFFVIPADDLGSPAEVDGRYTTFCHDGNYGQTGGPWSGDPTPPVQEPLLRFSWQLSF